MHTHIFGHYSIRTTKDWQEKPSSRNSKCTRLRLIESVGSANVKVAVAWLEKSLTEEPFRDPTCGRMTLLIFLLPKLPY